MFKFVCSTEEDVMDVIRVAKDMDISLEKIAIMPEGVSKEENAECFERIMPIILRECLQVTPRYHNVMYDGAKRKV